MSPRKWIERTTAWGKRNIDLEKPAPMTKHFYTEKHGDFLVVRFLDKNIYADRVVGSLGDEFYEIVRRPDCLKLVLVLGPS